eukprot:GDKI01021415.1.p1 GENE.GDKI01021415.1~~GDKI01021415.1.p1  ORF type:complete len:445 (-),score=53.34 GDKI01021415.1:69-1403(-)
MGTVTCWIAAVNHFLWKSVSEFARRRVNIARKMHEKTALEFFCFVIGGCILTAIAGFINTISLYGYWSVAVAFQTGNVNRISVALAEHNTNEFLLFSAICLSYTLGSTITGSIVGEGEFRISKRHGFLLILESCLLFFAYFHKSVYGQATPDTHTPLGGHGSGSGGVDLSLLSAAMACGIQNGFSTIFSHGMLRTTHMTGMLTDMGVCIGQILFNKILFDKNAWKLKVYISLLVCFSSGGILGCNAYTLYQLESLIFPSVLLVCVGGLVIILGACFNVRYEASKSQPVLLENRISFLNKDTRSPETASPSPVLGEQEYVPHSVSVRTHYHGDTDTHSPLLPHTRTHTHVYAHTLLPPSELTRDTSVHNMRARAEKTLQTIDQETRMSFLQSLMHTNTTLPHTHAKTSIENTCARGHSEGDTEMGVCVCSGGGYVLMAESGVKLV